MSDDRNQVEQTNLELPLAEKSEPELEPLPIRAHYLDSWFAKWFPESPPPGHPVPYLSGAWHHVREAFADLKQQSKE